jgi:hypothetical protein
MQNRLLLSVAALPLASALSFVLAFVFIHDTPRTIVPAIPPEPSAQQKADWHAEAVRDHERFLKMLADQEKCK